MNIFTLPVLGVITSGYGPRHDPTGGNETFHDGVDYRAKTGTAIHAPIAGTITKVWKDATNGKALTLTGKVGVDTYSFGFAHLTEYKVKQGDTVTEGEEIGTTGGAEGHSTGPHLHMTVRLNGQIIDPEKLAWHEKRGVDNADTQQTLLLQAIDSDIAQINKAIDAYSYTISAPTYSAKVIANMKVLLADAHKWRDSVTKFAGPYTPEQIKRIAQHVQSEGEEAAGLTAGKYSFIKGVSDDLYERAEKTKTAIKKKIKDIIDDTESAAWSHSGTILIVVVVIGGIVFVLNRVKE